MTNVTDLIATTVPATTDLLYTVVDPSGTPLDRKTTFASAVSAIPYVAKTANYTATEIDDVINCDATGGAFTITLPAVATTRAGKIYTIRKVDTSANAVIIDGNSAETITLYAADTTQILFTIGAYLTIQNTGTTWIVIASYGLVSGHTFLTTASATVANTASETTVIGSGIGTLTLPANFFRIGKTIRVVAMGFVSTTGTPTLNLKLKLGSTIIAATGAVTTGSGLATALLSVDALLTCRTVGGTGTVIASGIAGIGTVVAGVYPVSGTTVVVDTTAALAVGLTATWGAADPANTLTVPNVLVERVS